MFIDIDNFKSVNDTVGYISGDFVLQELISRLSNKIVDKRHKLYYLGVDLFAIPLW